MAQDDEIARLSIGDDATPTLEKIYEMLGQVADKVIEFAGSAAQFSTFAADLDSIVEALSLVEEGVVTGTSATDILTQSFTQLNQAGDLLTFLLEGVNRQFEDTANVVESTVSSVTPLEDALAQIASTETDEAIPATEQMQATLRKLSSMANALKPNIADFVQGQLDSATASYKFAQGLVAAGEAMNADSATMARLNGIVDNLNTKMGTAIAGLDALAAAQGPQQTLETMAQDTQALELGMTGLGEELPNIDTVLASIAEEPVAASMEQAAMGADNLARSFGANTEAVLAADTALQGADQRLSVYQQMANEAALALQNATAAEAENTTATKENTVAKDTNNRSGNLSAYMLLFVGQMALMAAQRFLGMGIAADQSLTTLQAMTQSTDAQMQGFTSTLEQMALKTGFGLKDLSDSLYYTVSASYSTSDALKILADAAMLARGGNASLKDTTDALTTVLDIYGHNAANAAHFSDLLTKAVIDGKQSMTQFTTAISVIAINAHAAKVPIEQLMAAESVLSLEMHNNSQSARDLSAMLRAMASGADATGGALAKLHLVFSRNVFDALNLTGKLEYLNTIAGDNTGEFLRLIGGMTGAEKTMRDLGLTTAQLAANAKALGFTFDAAKFNAMNAAQQLQYLMDISGNSATKFAALTGGAKNLNTALADLKLGTAGVAAIALHMGLSFDATSYNSMNLLQKLQYLWQVTHGNIAEFRSLVGGAAGANAAFALLASGGALYTKTLHDMLHASGATKAAFDTSMTSFTAQSGRAAAAAQNLSYNIVAMIKPAAAVFFGVLATMLQFFSQHADIVIPVLGGIAAVIISVLVPALIALIAESLSLDAALSPYIAVVAAVAVVVLLLATHWNQVMVAMRPLVPIFNSVRSALAPIFALLGAQFASIGAQFQASWHQIVTAIQPLMPVLKAVAAFFVGGFVVQLIVWIGILVGVVSGIAAGLASFVAGVATMFSGIMQIIAGFVQFFHGFFVLIDGILHGNMTTIKAGLGEMWAGILTMLRGYLTYLTGLFQATFGTVLAVFSGFALGILGYFRGMFSAIIPMTHGALNTILNGFVEELGLVIAWVQGFVQTIITFFLNLWHVLVGGSIVPDMVTGILQWFSNLVNVGSTLIANLATTLILHFLRLHDQAVNLVSQLVASFLLWLYRLHDQAIALVLSLVNLFLANVLHLNTQTIATIDQMVLGIIAKIQGLVSQMATFGIDMIENFIGGIQSRTGNLMSTVGNIASGVKHFLGFSVPEGGPLADADTYMPHMIDLFVAGMDAGAGKLQEASRRMATHVGSGVNLSANTQVSMATSPIVSILHQIHATLQQQNTTRATIGTPVPMAGVGSVTQQFGPVTLSGAATTQALYAQLNMLAGYAYEYGRRGATAGLPL